MKIGTTCKGIGPTYSDKYNRIGIRAIDLLSLDSLQEKINNRLQIAIKNKVYLDPHIKNFTFHKGNVYYVDFTPPLIQSYFKNRLKYL